MHLTLIIPELAAALAATETHAPRLARLIGRARQHDEPEGWPAALAPLYGIARQQDWPLAPLRALRHGIAPGAAYWLHATPVTMVPGRDDVRISGAAGVNEDEARAIVATLDRHFAADDMSFVALAPDEWVVRIARAPRLVTRALDTVVGAPLRSLLATGNGADEWRRWEQEMQMLLHTHAVNAAREDAGTPPVNGLWFDEGGTLPAPSNAQVATFGGDARIAALAHFAGADAAAKPATLDGALAASSTRERIVVVADTHDLAQIDAQFVAPAEAALRAGSLGAVSVMTAGRQGKVLTWTAGAPRWRDRWFGRSRADLHALVRDALGGAQA